MSDQKDITEHESARTLSQIAVERPRASGNNGGRKRAGIRRMSRLAAVLFAALLVGTLIITLELVHQGSADQTKITPTLTGTASTRAQWNHQNTVWGIFTMIDATTGWSEVGQFSVASLAATQNDTISGILRTTDGGNHWQDVTPPHSWFSTEAFVTATVAWGFGTYNNDGRDYMYRTVDGGRTWQVEPVPLSP